MSIGASVELSELRGKNYRAKRMAYLPRLRVSRARGFTKSLVLRERSYRLGIELPITDGVCRVLDREDLNDLAASLLGRQPTRE